ncbi:segregation/condensation protein A [Candidatus Nomurabacteria bacterium]|nr:segregation/condensation protein A [Candidatus Nomurabacteria bacterium]
MEIQSYTIKTPVFEGPFGVLLDLIEKRKLFINDVSLAQVTEDYLKYMKEIGELHPAHISSFVLVASTLLLIKSKSLLPGLELTDEEQGDIKSLEERLRLYELFTRLGGGIRSTFGKKMIFAPEERRHGTVIFMPDEQITRESMMVFVKNVLGAMPKIAPMPEVEVRKVISIEEMIENLTERIQKSLKMNFKDLHGQHGNARTKEEKVMVIVGFLAMLEMVRQGLIEAMQESHGGEIIMSNQVLGASD